MTTTQADPPELIVFDVGAGNCALVRDGRDMFVIDVPPQPLELQQCLEDVAELGLRVDGRIVIAAVLISHAHRDHCGGLSALLASDEVDVRRLYINSDPLKGTDAWEAIRIAIRDKRRRRDEFDVDNLTTQRNEQLRLQRLKVDVLAPSAALVAVSHPGGRTPEGRRLDSNSMSAVLRFSSDTGRGVLLASDIDEIGLDEMLAERPTVGAHVLVFPHHGGLPGGCADVTGFAAKLTAAVDPDLVVFSHGRQMSLPQAGKRSPRDATPRHDVMSGVRTGCRSGARIACTQLSTNCCMGEPPERTPTHFDALPARGCRKPGRDSRCAGSLLFRFEDSGVECDQLDVHGEWVKLFPDRMCAFTALVPSADSPIEVESDST